MEIYFNINLYIKGTSIMLTFGGAKCQAQYTNIIFFGVLGAHHRKTPTHLLESLN